MKKNNVMAMLEPASTNPKSNGLSLAIGHDA